MMRATIQTDAAPAAVGPYSQAVRLGDMVYCSGQIPLLPDGTLTGDTIEEQTRQVFRNISAVLAAAGSSLDNVVKATCFLKDFDQFAAFNEIYATYFTKDKPARSTVEVARLPKDVLVEVEVIAFVKAG